MKTDTKILNKMLANGIQQYIKYIMTKVYSKNNMKAIKCNSSD